MGTMKTSGAELDHVLGCDCISIGCHRMWLYGNGAVHLFLNGRRDFFYNGDGLDTVHAGRHPS